MPFLIGLLCWIAVNAWTTRRILCAKDFDHKGLYITVVWITPFLCAFIVCAQIRSYERAMAQQAAAPTAGVDAPAPAQSLSAPGVASLALEEHIGHVNGFPLLDWTAVGKWLNAIEAEPARRETRTQAQRAWLLHLRDTLGPNVWLFETEHAFVLSSLEEAVARATANYVETTRKRIGRLLGDLARFAQGEKSILLVLDDEDWYYQYVSIYYPEDGEFAFSGGMFIDAGCPHFVVKRDHLSAIEPTIAHELTHSALSYLKLPRWLDEGIAVNSERRLAGGTRTQYTPQQIHAMHLRFWEAQKMQEFWSGDAFMRTDDGNLLSYELARVLVDYLSRTWEPFSAFVRHADRADAGAAAAQTHLDIDLGACVCALVEREPSEDWAPRLGTPAAMH